MPISKKLRFEVFKRDKFQCQYCGRPAPDILLEIDHIKPRVSGGDDDILNLLTSCVDCNSGKGSRHISDDAAVRVQRKQLENLEKRREQLEMMLRWKENLESFKDEVEDSLASTWAKLCKDRFYLNEEGRRELRGLVRRFRVDEIVDAMKIASDHYMKFHNDLPTRDSVGVAWSKVGGVCQTNRLKASNPLEAAARHVRAILRNNTGYINESDCLPLIRLAISYGADIEQLKQFAKDASSWTRWREAMGEFIDELRRGSSRRQ